MEGKSPNTLTPTQKGQKTNQPHLEVTTLPHYAANHHQTEYTKERKTLYEQKPKIEENTRSVNPHSLHRIKEQTEREREREREKYIHEKKYFA